VNDERMEKRIEALMEAIGENLIESRYKYAEIVLNDSAANPDCYLNELEQNKATESYGAERQKAQQTKRGKRILKRIAGVAAVLVLTLGLVVSVSAEARLWLYNAVFENRGDHYVIVYGPADKDAPEYKTFTITYVPEGYELVTREVNVLGEGAMDMYEEYSLNGQVLFIEIYSRDHLVFTVDSEQTQVKAVKFDGIEGNYFYGRGYSFLLWSDGRYEYCIWGNLDVDEYIKISQGIKGKV